MKKIHVHVEIDLVLNVDDDANFDSVMESISPNFETDSESVDIEDSQIELFYLTDSR